MDQYTYNLFCRALLASLLLGIMTLANSLGVSIKMIKRLLRNAALFLLPAAILVGCSQKDTTQLQGYIEGEYVNVSSSVGGVLQQLDVDRGTKVKPNQALFKLDPNPELSQLKHSEYQLVRANETLANLIKGKRKTVLESISAKKAQAEATFMLASKDLRRKQILFKQSAIGRAALDGAQTMYRQSRQKLNEVDANLADAKLGARINQVLAQQAAVEAAKQEVKKWQWQLAQKTVEAPLGARVFDTYYRVGEYVPPGKPVLSLLAPKYIEVLFFVPETTLSNIKLDQTIWFAFDGAKKRLAAKISFISPEAEYTPPVIYSKNARAKLVYRVRASMSVDVARRVHPGQPVEVFLQPAKKIQS